MKARHLLLSKSHAIRAEKAAMSTTSTLIAPFAKQFQLEKIRRRSFRATDPADPPAPFANQISMDRGQEHAQQSALARRSAPLAGAHAGRQE